MPDAIIKMRKGGLEPPRPFGLTVLSRARLPFRHFRVTGGSVARLTCGASARIIRFPNMTAMRAFRFSFTCSKGAGGEAV